jgi:bud emergence protein 1
MKSFRRSQGQGHGHGNGHSHSNSHGQAGPSSAFRPPPGPNGPAPAFANPLSRPTERVAPPQKVIKALASHRSTNPQQLSYSKGDFWYVIGERDEWYEALSKFLLSNVLQLTQTPSPHRAASSPRRTLKSLPREDGSTRLANPHRPLRPRRLISALSIARLPRVPCFVAHRH